MWQPRTFRHSYRGKKAASSFCLATLRLQAIAPARWRPRLGTRSPCFAFWRYAIKRLEIFFVDKTGVRPSHTSRTQNFSSVSSKVDLRPADAASLNAFMATLSPADERLVSSWLLQKMPADAGAMVEKWWLGVRQAVLAPSAQCGDESNKASRTEHRGNHKFAKTNS